MTSPFFHTHAHSQFSMLDGLSKVPDLVRRAAKDGQPGLGLNDHGLMSGAVQLYKAASEYGIKPFPGFEGYLIDPEMHQWEKPPKNVKVERYHLGLMALTEDGYKALVRFMSMTHTRPRFSRFPRFTLSDLADLGQQHGDDLALTTGCFFGLVQQTLVNKTPADAKRVIEMYAKWFPNTYVELQNHNILHPNGMMDSDIVQELEYIANDLGLPMVAGQDNHYSLQSEKPAHELMKRMTYGGAEDEFPGDSFHLASTDWVKEHYTKTQWNSIEAGCQNLLDLHDLHITPLDKFTVDVPSMPGVKAPKRMIRSACERKLTSYWQQSTLARREQYANRLNYELDVINHLGMAAYFAIWMMFVEWCRDEKIAIEARGSANGSLVCYLLGITQVDPILRDVDFERFLTKDRIKPPDIDMDMEDSERPRAVQYLLSMFEAAQIGNFSKLGMTLDPDTGEERGSVMVTYVSSKHRECEEVALERYNAGKLQRKSDVKAYANGVFKRRYGTLKSFADVAAISPRDATALRQLDNMGSAYKSYGVHASGILLSGDHIKIEDYIPTMLVASSNTRVSQFDQDDVEEFGLLKMDLLGQSSLRVMKIVQQLMGRKDPTDFSWIPEDDQEAFKLLRDGRTMTGIFHFEGYTKSKGGRELGVKSVNDSILVHALYMPGTMDVAPGQKMSAKDQVVRARKDPAFRRSITYIHPITEKHLKSTFGAFVYQNQILAILRDLGMDVATTNTFLKIVKDSGPGAFERNLKRAEGIHATYTPLAAKAGIADPDALWEQLVAFCAYGFNKAHATGYGIRSYRMAYLKAHSQLEFMTGLLETWAGKKKEILYVREARRIKIRILPPHVNISNLSWTIDHKSSAIRKGLVSIDGVGIPTATQISDGAPYKSVEEMINQLPPRVITGGKMYLKEGKYSGILKKLLDTGAIDNMGSI